MRVRISAERSRSEGEDAMLGDTGGLGPRWCGNVWGWSWIETSVV